MTLTPEMIAMLRAAGVTDTKGWLPHDGGPCPVGIYRDVFVMFKDGKIDGPADAMLWEWVWRGDPIDDIIAYRLDRLENSNG